MAVPAVTQNPPPFLTIRAVLRTVLVVVAVAMTLVLIYLLRKPLTWIFIAAFIAIALSGPINLLQRRMKRGLAIAIVYVSLILTPFVLIGLLVPPIVTQANNLVNNLPEYAQEVTEFVNSNDQLEVIGGTTRDVSDRRRAESERDDKIQCAAPSRPTIAVV